MFCITWINVILRLIEEVVSRSFELTVSPLATATSRTGERGGGDGVQENRQTVYLLNMMYGVSVRAMFSAIVMSK
jgi:hypothetical protein